MAPWNKAHFQAGRQSVPPRGGGGGGEVAGGREGGRFAGGGEDLLEESPGPRGKRQASSKTESDTFSPNVILLKGTIIKGKVNTS